MRIQCMYYSLIKCLASCHNTMTLVLLKSIIVVNMTSHVGGLLFFFSLDETQEQHIGHCESARPMLECAFALFLASQWVVF